MDRRSPPSVQPVGEAQPFPLEQDGGGGRVSAGQAPPPPPPDPSPRCSHGQSARVIPLLLRSARRVFTHRHSLTSHSLSAVISRSCCPCSFTRSGMSSDRRVNRTPVASRHVAAQNKLGSLPGMSESARDARSPGHARPHTNADDARRERRWRRRGGRRVSAASCSRGAVWTAGGRVIARLSQPSERVCATHQVWSWMVISRKAHIKMKMSFKCNIAGWRRVNKTISPAECSFLFFSFLF